MREVDPAERLCRELRPRSAISSRYCDCRKAKELDLRNASAGEVGRDDIFFVIFFGLSALSRFSLPVDLCFFLSIAPVSGILVVEGLPVAFVATGRDDEVLLFFFLFFLCLRL
jgi:hypothetical protein